MKTIKFEELEQDIVFLMLKEGLPKGYSVVTAQITDREGESIAKGAVRKHIHMTYQDDKTKKSWTQSYNYKKILRTVDRGLAIEAQRN